MGVPHGVWLKSKKRKSSFSLRGKGKRFIQFQDFEVCSAVCKLWLYHQGVGREFVGRSSVAFLVKVCINYGLGWVVLLEYVIICHLFHPHCDSFLQIKEYETF